MCASDLLAKPNIIVIYCPQSATGNRIWVFYLLGYLTFRVPFIYWNYITFCMMSQQVYLIPSTQIVVCILTRPGTPGTPYSPLFSNQHPGARVLLHPRPIKIALYPSYVNLWYISPSKQETSQPPKYPSIDSQQGRNRWLPK